MPPKQPTEPPSPSTDETPSLDAATRRRLGYHLQQLFVPEPITAIDGRMAELLLQLGRDWQPPKEDALEE